jgi:hypothetical protein
MIVRLFILHTLHTPKSPPSARLRTGLERGLKRCCLATGDLIKKSPLERGGSKSRGVFFSEGCHEGTRCVSVERMSQGYRKNISTNIVLG